MKNVINPIRIPRKLKKKIIKKYSIQSYKLIMSGEYSIKYCSVGVFFNNDWIDVDVSNTVCPECGKEKAPKEYTCLKCYMKRMKAN